MTILSAAGILGGAIAALPHAVSAVGKALSLNGDAATKNATSTPPVTDSDSSIASLTKRLASLIRLSGVEPTEDVVVEDDGQGGVQVKGPKQTAEAVGQVLADNPDWVKDFRKLLEGNPDASIALSAATVQASSIDLTA